ncbi:MAG TPA: hypothetical protein VK390_06420 [Propionibacteriaceae bacterium]|nr:hypothetical protein [Propionibacteriaceae bacterium]
MGSMPTYHVSKGPFRFLDQLFANPSSGAFDAALTALGGPDAKATLHAAAQARQAAQPMDLAGGDVGHFDAHWLGGWWKELAPADTLRAGIREAITHAKNIAKPMEFFWICTQDREFQVYYCEGFHQVTVLILTPPPDPPGHSTDVLKTPELIWVVKLRDNSDLAYPALGTPGLIKAPVQVAEVTSGPPPPNGQPIVKQQAHHT